MDVSKKTKLSSKVTTPINSPLSNGNGPLGIDPTSLGTIKAKDLINNKPLANTILTYTKNCETKNSQLETENETLKTYANNYELNKYKAKNSVVLNLFATVLIGIGINFITSDHDIQPNKTDFQLMAGIITLSIGCLLYLYSQISLLQDRQ